MKRQLLVWLAMAVLHSNCTSSKLVNKSSSIYFDEINKTAKHRTGHIVLLNGREYDGNDIRARPDSTTWTHTIGRTISSSKTITQTVATSEVKEIVFKKRPKGALQGFLISGAIGGVVFSQIPCEGEDCGLLGLVGGTVVGVGAGLFVGLPIGAAIGSKEKYAFLMSE